MLMLEICVNESHKHPSNSSLNGVAQKEMSVYVAYVAYLIRPISGHFSRREGLDHTLNY